ncbi:DUF2382 domain-containing protein [Streptomyces capillispiralis]|uniref:Uncharacterized protein (TIGR02271 family) n=1 Tax=Streptomyces capillispiralis TaxID=68182 RepID=A0A561T8W0_9ACTN|nr:DUF2382 domain-containing protein [Streptomyces capillispiralis]TWF83545.1 uncharacterized protein (TIGR02271 family) [Streptomyces capillispiralis]GHH91665.1 photosystem reaction center subunit H [Streptomyces capillispiralis]
MITREEISILLDHPVYDGDGNKIGDAKHVFLDDASGRPEWVTVKTGMFGSNESFIPIRDASLVQDHLEVPYRKDKVKGAPNVDIDAGGHLSVDEEHRLYDYYGIDWDSVLTEPGERDRSPGMGTAGTAGAAGAAGAAGMAGRREREDTTRAAGAPGTTGKADMTGAPGTTGRAGMAGTAGTAGRRGEARTGARGDDAMTRSEERMRVGVERHESGRARLRKYVVTEEVQQTVPLRHEEVRVEREPITDANRGDAMSGPDFTEDEYEVTLHEERPVVETESVPVERVRLTTEEKTTDETVHGRVRKERIEAETEMEADERRRGRGGPGGDARGRDVPGRGSPGRDVPRRGRE